VQCICSDRTYGCIWKYVLCLLRSIELALPIFDRPSRSSIALPVNNKQTAKCPDIFRTFQFRHESDRHLHNDFYFHFIFRRRHESEDFGELDSWSGKTYRPMLCFSSLWVVSHMVASALARAGNGQEGRNWSLHLNLQLLLLRLKWVITTATNFLT